MAFVDVDPSAPVAPPGGKFHKFEKIGDKLHGLFVRHEQGKNQFEKTEDRYVFKTKDTATGQFVDTTVGANYDLNRRMQKALKEGTIKPGYKVIVQFVGEMPIEGQTKPMRVFKVVAEAPGTAPAAPAAPPPPPPPGDDIPW